MMRILPFIVQFDLVHKDVPNPLAGWIPKGILRIISHYVESIQMSRESSIPRLVTPGIQGKEQEVPPVLLNRPKTPCLEKDKILKLQIDVKIMDSGISKNDRGRRSSTIISRITVQYLKGMLVQEMLCQRALHTIICIIKKTRASKSTLGIDRE